MSVSDRDMLATRLNSSLPVRCIVALSSLIGRFLPCGNGSALFFFFPFCHVGGAEKVHASIVGCFAEERPWVFFTKRSVNLGFLSLFGSRARLCNLWFLLKYGYPVSVGVMAGFINRHTHPVVFGSNSLFFYLLLPYLRPDIRKVDLLHAFGGGIEKYSLETVPLLDRRVVINGKTGADLRQLYREQGMPAELGERITLIGNRIEMPVKYPVKVNRPRLSLLYVGRSSEEKRVHMIGRLATQCRRMGLPVDVVLAGDVAGAVNSEDLASCIFVGEIADASEMDRLYDNADLLLLTSQREGFPLVIMEAMAHGVVPLTTAVGGIPEHVVDGVNGWLVENSDEDQILTAMCVIIGRICVDRPLLSRMSSASYEYAGQNFGGERFCQAYRRLLLTH